jgi:hypothetical protein
MKLPPWGRFEIDLKFRENLGKSKTWEVEFTLSKYAIYFSSKMGADRWDAFWCTLGRKIFYLTPAKNIA